MAYNADAITYGPALEACGLARQDFGGQGPKL